MKRERKPFPFWLVCVLVLLCSPFIGGLSSSLFVRVVKGARAWRELPPPSGERVVAILDAAITTDKEHRLCVRTERGAVYLWRKHYRSGRLDPDGPQPDQYWHVLRPLPDGQAIKHLIVSEFYSDNKRPLVAVKSENGQTYAWQNDNWQPFEKTTVFGWDWPRAWPSDGGTKLRLLIQTNNVVSTNSESPSIRESKPRREFRSWFTLPRPPGKVVDETKVSFEGSLSDWVSSYVLLEDGRLLVLAAERDLADVVIELAGAAVALLAGIVLLIILGIRRRRANARSSETVRTSCSN